jgi:hypothetical protein
LVIALLATAAYAEKKEDEEKSDNKKEGEKKKGALAEFLKEHKKDRKVLETCSGDTRYDKCQRLGFRVCLRLLNDDNTPYEFGEYNPKVDTIDDTSHKRIKDGNKDGDLNWWEWSTQPEHMASWIAGIKHTGGHHWCACSLCFSEAVTRWGCDKLDFVCDASDVAFLRERVEKDDKKSLAPALECLYKKCGKDFQKGWPVEGNDCKHRGCARLYEEDGHSLASMGVVSKQAGAGVLLLTATAAGVFVGLVSAVSIYRRVSSKAAAEPREAPLRTEGLE